MRVLRYRKNARADQDVDGPQKRSGVLSFLLEYIESHEYVGTVHFNCSAEPTA